MRILRKTTPRRKQLGRFARRLGVDPLESRAMLAADLLAVEPLIEVFAAEQPPEASEVVWEDGAGAEKAYLDGEFVTFEKSIAILDPVLDAEYLEAEWLKIDDPSEGGDGGEVPIRYVLRTFATGGMVTETFPVDSESTFADDVLVDYVGGESGEFEKTELVELELPELFAVPTSYMLRGSEAGGDETGEVDAEPWLAFTLWVAELPVGEDGLPIEGFEATTFDLTSGDLALFDEPTLFEVTDLSGELVEESVIDEVRTLDEEDPNIILYMSAGGPGDDLAAQTGVITVSWHNAAEPVDVNGDGYVSPLDALLMVSWINENGTGAIGGEGEASGGSFFPDINDDGVVTPLDCLVVFNHLNGAETVGNASDESQGLGDPFAIIAILDDGSLTEDGSDETDAIDGGESSLFATEEADQAFARLALNDDWLFDSEIDETADVASKRAAEDGGDLPWEEWVELLDAGMIDPAVV
ncbi:MAG: dockerin type I domain-containing protein [Pirellulales bacterium]